MLSKFSEDLKAALKARDKIKVSALRNIIAKVKAIQIDRKTQLTDADIQKILLSYTKQLRDSIDQYQAAGREDLVENETAELRIIESYLPEQMTEDEIKAVVQKIIGETGAATMTDMGKVMPLVMQAISGKGDGKIASKFVREFLG
ncbi:MAG: GatB/YqeY domain-containing protein [FCB group bacterium]|nr:GatB/YqeY domain-containing protein [FCB group bacterium]